MIISAKVGNLKEYNIDSKQIDFVDLEWYETNKRIIHKKSRLGQKVSVRFLNQNPEFTQGDILNETENNIIAINILPCDCLVVKTNTVLEVASVSYEIGNRHIPLFFDENELLVAFEKPLFKYLEINGFKVRKENRQLLRPLKTTVLPHGNNQSLFTKIMQLTN